MLNMLLTKSFNDDCSCRFTIFFLKAISDFASNFLHDFHIRPLSDFLTDLNLVTPIMRICDFGLSDLLIENLIKESGRISIN